MIGRRRNVRSVAEHGEHRLQLGTRRRVRLSNQPVKDGVAPLVNGVRSTGRRRLAARRTVFMVRRQRSRTIPTRLSDSVRPLVGIQEPGFPEDVFVVFGRRDVLVCLPHRGIERPVNAMLDLRARVALSNHPRDRGVPERMRVRRLLHAGTLRDPAELLTHRVRRHPAVVTPSLIAVTGCRLHLMEQRHIRVLGARMPTSKVRPDRGRGVDQGIARNRGALQSECVAVRRVGRRCVEVDVADAKRQRHRQSTPGVREELDERDVTLMPRSRDEIVDIWLDEDLVFRGRIRVDGGSIDVLGPLGIRHLLDERQDRVLVALNRRVREIVVVPEREHEVVPAIFVELDERRLAAFTPESAPAEIDFDAGDLEAAVDPTEVSTECVSILLVDVGGVCEPIAFILEATGEVLGVVERHTPTASGRYYKLTTRESTSSISSERVKPAGSSPETGKQGVVV